MNRPTAYLISGSDHYGHRLGVIDEQLKKLGYDTIYITSDFDHTLKSSFACDVPGCVQLHVLPYYKNLSIRRIISHWQFARKVFSYLEKLDEEPNVVVGLVPPNFLAYYLSKYKRRHKTVKLMYDVFDLWPETFPSAGLKKLLMPAFSLWARLRDCSLPEADFITTECEMFREKLGLSKEKSTAIYLCGEELGDQYRFPVLAEDRWELCYLGAVNNVIGIPEICRLVDQLHVHRPVTVHIIGTGERLQEFKEQLRASGADVVCHGTVYDDAHKQEIIHRCHFGINIVRASACIGLTMKSVDYFRHGLPVISNVPGDTQLLLEQYGAGIQLGEQTVDKLQCMQMDDYLQMRENARNVFLNRFSKHVIEKQYQTAFDLWL